MRTLLVILGIVFVFSGLFPLALIIVVVLAFMPKEDENEPIT